VNRRAAGRDTPAARIAGYAAIDRLSSVSSGVVYGGDHRTAGSWPGVRAAINARLEEVSFRTGMMTGAIAFLALAAATAAVVLTVMPSQGSPVNGAVGVPAAASSPVAASAVPVAAPSVRTPAHGLHEVSFPSSSAPAAGTQPTAEPAAQPAAQASQSSAYPSSSPQSGSAGRTFGGPAAGREAQGGYWPGSRNGAGAPRFASGRGNFTGGLGRFGPGNEAFAAGRLACGAVPRAEQAHGGPQTRRFGEHASQGSRDLDSWVIVERFSAETIFTVETLHLRDRLEVSRHSPPCPSRCGSAPLPACPPARLPVAGPVPLQAAGRPGP
jgi:hypothetical protein